MKKLKNRIAFLLCILMAVSAVSGCLPMAALKAEAAGNVDIDEEEYFPSLADLIRVEKGVTFDLGDGLYVNENDKIKYFEDISNEKYTSSNTKVATISGNNGTIRTKKAGTTTVKVTYKKTSYECKIIVTEKGKLGTTSRGCKTLRNKAKAVIKAYGGGMTSKNRYKVQQALNNLEMACDKASAPIISRGGFKTKWDKAEKEYTSKLLVPELLKVRRLELKIQNYILKNNPIGRMKSKWFKVKSVSGKGNRVTVTLKNKATSAQIFAIKADINEDTHISTGKTAAFPVYLKDSAGYYYRGKAVATEGSKKIDVIMDYMTMKKNKEYILVGADDWFYQFPEDKSWTNNTSFNAN